MCLDPVSFRWKEARSSLSGVVRSNGISLPIHPTRIVLASPQGNGATSIFLQAATWIKDPKIVNDFRRFCIVW